MSSLEELLLQNKQLHSAQQTSKWVASGHVLFCKTPTHALRPQQDLPNLYRKFRETRGISGICWGPLTNLFIILNS